MIFIENFICKNTNSASSPHLIQKSQSDYKQKKHKQLQSKSINTISSSNDFSKKNLKSFIDDKNIKSKTNSLIPLIHQKTFTRLEENKEHDISKSKDNTKFYSPIRSKNDEYKIKVLSNLSPYLKDISPKKKARVTLIGDIINFKKENKFLSKKNILPFKKKSNLINFPVDKHKKVNLTNAIYYHLPKQEDFTVQIEKEKERQKKIFSNTNWKKHTKGEGKSLYMNMFDNIYGSTIFKTKDFLLKQEGFHTLDYFDTMNVINKSNRNYFNKETIQSQIYKQKLQMEDIQDLIDRKIITQRVLFDSKSTSLPNKSKIENKSKLNSTKSIMVNKKMIMLPNGKVRPITPWEREIEKELVDASDILDNKDNIIIN